MTEGKFKPLGDKVLIAYQDGETKTKSGLILTDSSQRGQKVFGEVLAVGTGIFSQTGERIPMTVKEGDEVKFAAFAGKEIKVEGKEYFLMPQSEIQGIIGK